MLALFSTLLAGLVAYRIRETINPIVNSLVSSMAEAAKKNTMLCVLAFMLAASATADSIADIFTPIEPADWAKFGWWQIGALFVKAFKPFCATIAALLVNPPMPKMGQVIAVEPKKDPTTTP